MPLSAGVRAIMGAFGPMLETALDLGRGAQAMWNTYKDVYANLGIDRPPAGLQDMNTFVAGLGGFVRSVEAMAAAADGDALGPSHWAYPIGYDHPAADYAAPSMLVTFESQIETEAGEVTRWSSVTYNAIFPATVGQLRSEAVDSVQTQLDLAAMDEGEESPTAGGAVVGLGRMYLTVKGV
jgi:hypothetical protein